MTKTNLFDAMHAASAPAPVSADIQRILDRISADAAERNRLAEADAARSTTVTVEFTRDNGDELTVTLTGIAPFAAEPVVGPWTGAPGWGVLGRPWSSKGPAPSARATAIQVGGLFPGKCTAFPLLTEAEANRLAAQIASIPAIQNRKAA